jgi:hypothetical protein
MRECPRPGWPWNTAVSNSTYPVHNVHLVEVHHPLGNLIGNPEPHSPFQWLHSVQQHTPQRPAREVLGHHERASFRARTGPEEDQETAESR